MITPWAGIALGLCLGLNSTETVVQDDSLAKIDQEFGQAYNKARRKLGAEAISEFCDRCFNLASDDLEQQVPALMQVLMYVGTSNDENLDEAWTEAVELMIESYVDEPEIAGLVMRLSQETGRRAEDAAAYLDEVEEETGSKQIKALIDYGRLQALQQAYVAASRGGPELGKKQKKQLIKGLENAVANLGDLEDQRGRLFKDVAAGTLFEMQNLQIGCKVPDIEGTDLDGVAFKLSDYKGKVVMIDFWGHW